MISLNNFFKKIWHAISYNFIFVAVASFIWLVYRTGTKPSRITYPCQQAALSNVGILIFLLPAFHIDRLRKLIQRGFQPREIFRGSLKVVFLLVLFSFAASALNRFNVYQSMQSYIKSSKGPLGVKTAAGAAIAGIAAGSGFATIPSAQLLPSPHRVVSVHDKNASSWSGSGTPHGTFNQSIIDAMVAKGVMELTEKNTAAEAWAALVPYQTGEIVAIKLNFNNAGSWDNNHYMNPYAELIKSVIAGLNSIGVPSNRIRLTDPSRLIPDSFRTRIGDPNVQYYVGASADIGGRANVHRIGFVDSGSGHATVSQVSSSATQSIRPSQVFVDAHHIINIPQLKGHGGASITLGLKNHFGSIYIDNAQGFSDLHNYFYTDHNSGTTYNMLADISNNPVFKNKTRLVIGDGLMGHSSINYQDPHTWTSFGGSPPEILFFGVDPVAIDSVMTDYLNRENSARSESLRKDNILVYAASIGLGVFEHWDGSTTRNYSGTGINYVEIDNDTGLCKNCMGDPAADLTVTEGTAVNIVIKGISCGGKTVTMEYHEIDRGSKQQITGNYNLPATAEFSNDTAAVSWTAEWFDDVDGYDADPEIQFTAVCGSSSRISSTLKVVKAGGGK